MINILTKISMRRLLGAPSQKNVDKLGKTVKKIEIDLSDRILVNINSRVYTLQVVEDRFAELTDDKVSMFTPLGATLIGKTVNDEFEIIMPKGEFIRCKVLEIL